MVRKRLLVAMAAVATAVVLGAAPALACGGLVAPNGTVRLLRTTTLAAWHDGVEHYVTSFQFAGGGAEFGSIIPLPAIPTKVERGGDWTLQRLEREVQPPAPEADFAAGAVKASAAVQVIEEKRIDALDITILKGGGSDVGQWAKEHGFLLTPDAPEILDFYSSRSPVFMAARFDAAAARALGQGLGDGTPIHLTMPTPAPWVPLRILGLGRGVDEPVNADVFLLTDHRPDLLAVPGVSLQRSEPASTQLLSDLGSDKGMDWMPQSMWLSFIQVNARAGILQRDLSADATGAGLLNPVDPGVHVPISFTRLQPVKPAQPAGSHDWSFALTAIGILAVAGVAGLAVARVAADR